MGASMALTGWAGALALVAGLWSGAAAALPEPGDGGRFAVLTEALEARDWQGAEAIAAGLAEPAARALVRWRRLSDGEGRFEDYARFLSDHPDWPGRAALRRLAERRMPERLSPLEVLGFFERSAPLTGTGAARLAEAWRAEGRVAEARATAIRAWETLSLTHDEERALLDAWGGAFAGAHPARLEMLLWRGLGGEAERMLGRVDPGLAALARARIALRRGDAGVNALIDRVPAALADDPGLAYERFRWRDAKGLDDGALEMMRARSVSAAALGRPGAWADRRMAFARRADWAGDPRLAYELASRHFTTPEIGYDHAELEWFAGWIALRELGEPGAAARHFETFLAAVETPISLGRGWYWLGRARAAAGDAAGAEAAWREGARWQTSFYGQLAAEAAGAAPDPGLAGSPLPTDWRRAAIVAREPVRAGVLAHWAGERGLSWRLLVHATRLAETPRDFAALGALALELDRPEIAVRAGKAAARLGLVLPTPYYPVTGLAAGGGAMHPALLMAVARQESELNPEAISHAGARGLMQVMPATAESVSRRLGLAYSRGALTADWRYNARLGDDYLRGLWEEFGSLPLVAAGYNAGPHRVRGWLERYGDPRGRGIEAMVDWIETIPFGETRNYVQRVLEGRQVYAARIAGRATPHETGARLR